MKKLFPAELLNPSFHFKHSVRMPPNSNSRQGKGASPFWIVFLRQMPGSSFQAAVKSLPTKDFSRRRNKTHVI